MHVNFFNDQITDCYTLLLNFDFIEGCISLALGETSIVDVFPVLGTQVPALMFPLEEHP